MEKIILNEVQHNELCLELARLVSKFKKNKNVDCIYFNVFDSLGAIRDVINVNIVIYNYDNRFIEELEKLNKKFYETEDGLSKYGIKIYLSYGRFDNYCLIPNGVPDILLARDLYSSTILFDRTGNLTNLQKEQIESKDESVQNIVFEYNNLGTLEPPIEANMISDNLEEVRGWKILKKRKEEC